LIIEVTDAGSQAWEKEKVFKRFHGERAMQMANSEVIDGGGSQGPESTNQRGSPLFAPPACWVLNSPCSPYDYPKRIVTPDHAAAEDNLTSVCAINQFFLGFAVIDRE
jgi:hypothetical protein